MSTIEEASGALAAALRTITELRVYDDPGAVFDPPAALVAPPELTWDAYSSDPTGARFVVVVMVAADGQANRRLWDLVPRAAVAIETVEDAAVRQASPGLWTTGSTELPCYQIQIEVSL